MRISIALGTKAPYEDYGADVDLERFRGKFDGFDKTGAKWQALLSAVITKTAFVTIEGRAYKMTALDSEGNFTLG